MSPPGRLVGPPSHMKPPRRCVIVASRRRSKVATARWGSLFALHMPGMSRHASRRHDTSRFNHLPHPSAPSPTDNKSIQFCVWFRHRSAIPSIASSLALSRRPQSAHVEFAPMPPIRTFLTSSTNFPRPFVPHDQHTIPALTFSIPPLTQPGFSKFITTSPCLLSRPRPHFQEKPSDPKNMNGDALHVIRLLRVVSTPAYQSAVRLKRDICRQEGEISEGKEGNGQ